MKKVNESRHLLWLIPFFYRTITNEVSYYCIILSEMGVSMNINYFSIVPIVSIKSLLLKLMWINQLSVKQIYSPIHQIYSLQAYKLYEMRYKNNGLDFVEVLFKVMFSWVACITEKKRRKSRQVKEVNFESKALVKVRLDGLACQYNFLILNWYPYLK